MQNHVCTYVPLDGHGPETNLRAVCHQNARASVFDLMTEFDQPDCSFSVPKCAETTTPLQALTMFNHNFTLDTAAALAERLEMEVGNDVEAEVRGPCQLCDSRPPTSNAVRDRRKLIEAHSLPVLCRVGLNTSEIIYVR